MKRRGTSLGDEKFSAALVVHAGMESTGATNE
jgi:hypothetical protein